MLIQDDSHFGSRGSDMSEQLDYSKYFPHIDDPLIAGIAILIMFIVGLIAGILIYKNKMTKISKIVLLISSISLGGLIFGGFPNIIYLTGLTFLILGISLFFSRVFCGYVCPLGACQELISMIRFKAIINFDQVNKKSKNAYVRFAFFGFFIVLVLIWGFNVLEPLNPLNGFLLPWFPFEIIYLTAFILLISIIILSLFIYRPFCRYVCPFGLIASFIGRFSIIKIRRNENCLDCGLCEKICPTYEGFQKSKKGECYLCYRCMEFCQNEMFIDPAKVSQIHRSLIAFQLAHNKEQREEFLDKILKNVIRLFLPYKRKKSFDKFMNAMLGSEKFSNETVQKLINQLCKMFPDEICKIDKEQYKQWINENESKWKTRLDSYQKDKLHYGLAKEK